MWNTTALIPDRFDNYTFQVLQRRRWWLNSLAAFLPTTIGIRTCVYSIIWLIFQLESWSLSLIHVGELRLVDLLHQVTHELVDVNVLHGWCFVVSHVVLLGHFSSLLFANFPIIYHIDFVTNEYHRHVVIGELLETLHPHFHVFERCYIGYVKSKDDTLRLFIEGLC